MENTITTRCTICRAEFTEKEMEDVSSCPSCDTKSLPCDVKDDVTVKLNWHELRILGIWAENWAMQIRNEHLHMPAVTGTDSVLTIASIAKAIQDQYPDKTPITLTGELRTVRKEFPNMETNVDLSPNLVALKGGKHE